MRRSLYISCLTTILAFPAIDALAVGPLTDPATAGSAGYTGPDAVKVDLLRPGKSPAARNRIFVQALLPNGEKALFLVDTGAAVSVISEQWVERLNLPMVRDFGSVEGLGGRSSYHYLVIPELRLGADPDSAAVLRNVEFGTGVPGIPENAGWMPLAGILGNNVWQQFVVELDYPADRMVLHRPGTFRMPRSSAPMQVEGAQVFTPVGVKTDTTPPLEGLTVLQLDTGAGGLMFAGKNVLPFELTPGAYSEGVEPILGVGAADTMPANTFLRNTLRVPIRSLMLGGRTVPLDLEARWMNYDGGLSVGPSGLAGLVGHEVFADYRVIFNFPGEQFAMLRSRRPGRRIDGHAVLLADDLEQYGDDARRGLHRAKLSLGLEDWKAAERYLTAFVASGAPSDDVGEARMLLSIVARHRGDLAASREALAPLSPRELVEQGEILASVNGLILDDRAADALSLANAARDAWTATTDIADDEELATNVATALTARADALLALGRGEEAKRDLLEAAARLDNPDAQLLRRARVAAALGDEYGSLAHVRRLLQLFPLNGQYLWFYSTFVRTDSDRVTFRADLEAAMARLHPNDRPFDFLTYAYHLLGDAQKMEEMRKLGTARDCVPLDDDAMRDNCDAWYLALSGRDLDRALDRIERALSAKGDRSDFLDTKAMVLLSRGETQPAAEVAMAAARLASDDVYMLWQAERMRKLVQDAGPSTGSTATR